MQDEPSFRLDGIGDVVKYRLEETEMEARVLRDYVIASR